MKLKYNIRKGTNVNLKNKDGYTALMMAARHALRLTGVHQKIQNKKKDTFKQMLSIAEDKKIARQDNESGIID